MTRLAWTGVLLGLLTACGDNGNDVGIFKDEGTGGTSLSDGSTDSASTDGSGTTADGSSDSSSSGTDATAEGSTSGTDGETSSGGAGTTSGQETATDGMGGTGASGGEETTTGGSGGVSDGSGGVSNGSGGVTNGSGGVTNGSGGVTNGSGGVTNGSGGATSGGGSSNGGSAGSGGGTNQTCPEERPTANTECDTVGVCNYGTGCEPDAMACEEGLWVEVTAEPITCEDFGPGSYPENGDSCECLGDLRCQFLDCEGRGTIRASCNEGTWEVHDSDCVSRTCPPNGDGEDVATCAPGEICVASHGGLAITYGCEANPCADSRLQNSCECGRSLCPESDAWRCEMQEDATVLACICDECN